MKKTSRRKFGKQLTGALAALPVAALAMSESTSGQTKPIKPNAVSDESVFNEHNTPPPVLLMQGSFIVETAEAVFDESVTMGSRKKYRRHPKVTTKKVHLAHVKIIDGSGEILYRNDNIMNDSSHPPIDLRVAVTTDDGLVNIASVGNNFELDIPGNKKFEKTTHSLDQPMGSKRLARFRYRDDDSSGSDVHRIKEVRVTKGASTLLFEIKDLTDLPSKGEELRIMVWLEET